MCDVQSADGRGRGCGEPPEALTGARRTRLKCPASRAGARRRHGRGHRFGAAAGAGPNATVRRRGLPAPSNRNCPACRCDGGVSGPGLRAQGSRRSRACGARAAGGAGGPARGHADAFSVDLAGLRVRPVQSSRQVDPSETFASAPWIPPCVDVTIKSVHGHHGWARMAHRLLGSDGFVVATGRLSAEPREGRASRRGPGARRGRPGAPAAVVWAGREAHEWSASSRGCTPPAPTAGVIPTPAIAYVTRRWVSMPAW